jgi:hypothetical protein
LRLPSCAVISQKVEAKYSSERLLSLGFRNSGCEAESLEDSI